MLNAACAYARAFANASVCECVRMSVHAHVRVCAHALSCIRVRDGVRMHCFALPHAAGGGGAAGGAAAAQAVHVCTLRTAGWGVRLGFRAEAERNAFCWS